MAYGINNSDDFTVLSSGTNLDFNGTTPDPYADFWRMYNQRVELYHPTLGITLLILCLIGMVTNLLNIIALSMMVKHSKLPVYRCFLGLSIADFMIVLLQSVYSGNQFINKEKLVVDSVDAYYTEDQTTNIIHFIVPHIMNIFFAASNWCVVIMSVFRFIAVFTPLWYQRRFTQRAVNIIMVAVYILSFLINIPSFTHTKYISQDRRFSSRTDQVKTLGFNPKYISLIMVQVVPMFVTVLLLVPLVVKLCSHDAVERSASNSEYRGRERKQASCTLIAISTFFVICLTPNIVNLSWRYLAKKSYDNMDPVANSEFHVAIQICMFTNHVANFFFYILLNAKLRHRLKFLLRCITLRVKENGSCLGIGYHLSESERESFRGTRYSQTRSNGRNSSIRDIIRNNGDTKDGPDSKLLHIHRDSYVTKKMRTQDVNGNIDLEKSGLVDNPFYHDNVSSSENRSNSQTYFICRDPSTDTFEISSIKDFTDIHEKDLLLHAKVASIDSMDDLSGFNTAQTYMV